MPDPITGADVEELEALIEFTKLRAYRILKKINHEYRINCLEKSHASLRKHEDRKAGEWLAKSEVPAKILQLIQMRMDELESKAKGVVQ